MFGEGVKPGNARKCHFGNRQGGSNSPFTSGACPPSFRAAASCAFSDAYDRLRDDRHDFPPHDDRADEEAARYDGLGAAVSGAERTEPC